MTIASEIQDLQNNLQAAKSAVTTKGGTVADTGLAGLATEIASIPGGGGSIDYTDAQSVYEATRPSDWIKMPTTVNDNEMYWLLQIPNTMTGNVHVGMGGISYATSTSTVTVEFGSTSGGVFVPDSDLTVTLTRSQAGNGLKISVPVEKFTALTSDGMKQLLMKISADGNMQSWNATGSNNSSLKSMAVEYSGKTHFTNLEYAFASLASIRYISLVNISNSSAYSARDAFINCSNLICFPIFDVSGSWNNAYEVFSEASSLLTAPQLPAITGANASMLFATCRALKYVPVFETSSVTNFSSMFSTCTSLVNPPLLDTSSGTNLNNMFGGCSSLRKVPDLDTSSVTNIGNMFTGCKALNYADFTNYDFSKISSTSGMNFFAGNLPGNAIVILGDKFSSYGIRATSSFVSTAISDSYPGCHVKINKSDGVLGINSTAANIFLGTYTYVYVPDDLLSAYQADTNWASLDTDGRLKPMSEFPYIPS